MKKLLYFGSLLLSISLILTGCAHQTNRVSRPAPFSLEREPYALKRQLSTLKTIPVGYFPKSVSISPDNKRAYVCNLEGGSIDIIRTDTLTPIKRIKFRTTLLPLPDGSARTEFFEEKPVEIGFTGRGRYVWISLLRAGGVVIFDTKMKIWPSGIQTKIAREFDYQTKRKRTVKLRFIPTGDQPKIIAVSPDEKWVFVANWRSRAVTVIDARRFTVKKVIKTGYNPRGICFTPSKAYVANFGSNTISEIDLKTLKKARDFHDVGKNPRHLLLSPDGESIFVSNHGDKHIRQIDLFSGQTIRECTVGNEPRTICLSRLQNFLFVTNYKDDTITAIDLRTMSPALVIDTLQRPIGAAFDTQKDTLWVTGYWEEAVRVYKFKTSVEPLNGTGSQGTGFVQTEKSENRYLENRYQNRNLAEAAVTANRNSAAAPASPKHLKD